MYVCAKKWVIKSTQIKALILSSAVLARSERNPTELSLTNRFISIKPN